MPVINYITKLSLTKEEKKDIRNTLETYYNQTFTIHAVEQSTKKIIDYINTLLDDPIIINKIQNRK